MRSTVIHFLWEGVWDYSNYKQLFSPRLRVSLSSQRRGWTCEAEEGERALRETEESRERERAVPVC